MKERIGRAVGIRAGGALQAVRRRRRGFSLGRRIASVLQYVLPTTRWGDCVFAIMAHMFKLRRVPRLRPPKLFNDHLLELKLSGALSDPFRQFITDKEYAKDYIAWVVGPQYVLRTYDILRTELDVDRFVVKDTPCVVKPTHLSGSSILVQLDRSAPVDRQEMKCWLKSGYYRRSREINYRFLERKVIVEELHSWDGYDPPPDYKMFCFQGDPRLIQVDTKRFTGHTRNIYDMEWNRLPITIEFPAGIEEDPKPSQFEEMIEIAKRLSRPFAFLRVDMYANDTGVKVGELTNVHGNATEGIQPAAAERWMGELFEGGRSSVSPWHS